MPLPLFDFALPDEVVMQTQCRQRFRIRRDLPKIIKWNDLKFNHLTLLNYFCQFTLHAVDLFCSHFFPVEEKAVELIRSSTCGKHTRKLISVCELGHVDQ